MRPGPNHSHASGAPRSVAALLDAVERELDQMAQAVVAGAPEVLERHGPRLQHAVIALGDAGARGLSEAEQERLLACAARLSQVRSNLSRRSAAVERELAILMPERQPGTYRTLDPATRRALRV